MKKILIVVDSINIEDSSGSKVNVALIHNLVAAGFEIMVYHFTLKNIQLKGVNCVAIPEIKFSPLYILSRIQRVLSRKLSINFAPFLEKKMGFSFTFFNDTNSIVRALKKCTFEPDLLLTLSKGGSFRPHYAVLQLSELHFKWMAYVHDPYPFHYYPRPYNWVEPGYQFKEDFFREVSEKAKYSGFPSLLLKEWMGSYFPKFLETGVVIPHQTLKINRDKIIDVPNFLDLEKFNLLHAGNLMSKRNPRFLVTAFLDFLKEIPESKNEAKLIFLGNADYYKNYMNKIVSDVIYWSGGNVPFETVEVVQNNASVNIILEAKSEISPFLPGKFPNCVNANKPILFIGPYYSETKRLLGDTDSYLSEIDDVKLIKNNIIILYNNWKAKSNQYLNRKDLEFYLGVEHLKEVVENLFKNE